MRTTRKFLCVLLILMGLGCMLIGYADSNGGSDEIDIIFLHHSTGENIWNGGVSKWFVQYNSKHDTHFQIVEQNFPEDSPYGWNNYPYDYWNIWVNHAGSRPYLNEPTLELLTSQYHFIIFKHCFPVSEIEADTRNPDIFSEDKRVENYILQYQALKSKMHKFPDTIFLVWTGAALTQQSTDEASAKRARNFFEWVKNKWDDKGDNIYIWDFYELETEGGLYMKDKYAEDPYDSHPNSTFSQMVAPLFGQRIVDVIEGRGDNTSLTGR